MHTFIKSEPNLYTVGSYTPEGEWDALSDHETEEEAREAVAHLNGGVQSIKAKSETKSEFIKRASVQLLASHLIGDRIEWYKDINKFGEDSETLISLSVELSELLWNELERKNYV